MLYIFRAATFGLRPFETCNQPHFFAGGSQPNYLAQFQRDASINPFFINESTLVAHIVQDGFSVKHCDGTMSGGDPGGLDSYRKRVLSAVRRGADRERRVGNRIGDAAVEQVGRSGMSGLVSIRRAITRLRGGPPGPACEK